MIIIIIIIIIRCFVTRCATSSFSRKTFAQSIYSLQLRYNPGAYETSNRQTTALLLLLSPEHRGWPYLTLVFFLPLMYRKAVAQLTIQNIKNPLITVPIFLLCNLFWNCKLHPRDSPFWQPCDVRYSQHDLAAASACCDIPNLSLAAAVTGGNCACVGRQGNQVALRKHYFPHYSNEAT
jgi:hypothetical protein